MKSIEEDAIETLENLEIKEESSEKEVVKAVDTENIEEVTEELPQKEVSQEILIEENQLQEEKIGRASCRERV